MCNMRELQPKGEKQTLLREKKVVRQQQLQRLTQSPERSPDRGRVYQAMI